MLPHGKGTVVTKSKAASDALATSRSLLDRVRVADEAAWDRLVTLYAPLVMHWCRLGSLDEQDADEGSAVSLDEEDEADRTMISLDEEDAADRTMVSLDEEDAAHQATVALDDEDARDRAEQNRLRDGMLAVLEPRQRAGFVLFANRLRARLESKAFGRGGGRPPWAHRDPPDRP